MSGGVMTLLGSTPEEARNNVVEALNKAGSADKASEVLGISTKTLYRIIKQFKIKRSVTVTWGIAKSSK